MENTTLMGELQKLLVEQLRRSGLPVTLLCIGMWSSWELRQTDKKELTEAFQLYKLETGLEIKALKTRLEACNDGREKLYIEVANLRAQVNYLTAERRK